MSVDKDALFRLLGSRSGAYASSAFDRETIDVLGISNVQVAHVQDAIVDVVEQLKVLEKTNHVVESDDEGNEWIAIKAFGSGRLQEQLEDRLKVILGAENGDLAWRRVKDTRTFSGFGELERKLFIEERDQGSRVQYAITEELYKDGKMFSGFSTTVRPDDRLWSRYDHLLKR